jgi:hypothetical protein
VATTALPSARVAVVDLTLLLSRAVSQATSRQLAPAAARVRSGHVGFMVDRAALGQVFS